VETTIKNNLNIKDSKIMQYSVRKRTTYIPGMVTLIFLPWMVFKSYTIQTDSLWKSCKAIPLMLADSSLIKRFPDFYKQNGNRLIPARNYLEIVLTGDYHNDSCKLAFAKIRIEEIVSSNDSINGIHFCFGEQTEYWEFVVVIDNLRQEGAKRYAPFDNDVWFYCVPEDKSFTSE